MKIAVFDSGFGSLSIIKELQKMLKSEIIYFADQKNFPYGKKSISYLRKIITKTISKLETSFSPDLIIIASNTPSILLEKDLQKNQKLILVLPPLQEAIQLSKSKEIAILATNSVVKSKTIKQFLQNNVSGNVKIKLVNTSPLVELVEKGIFISNKKFCQKRIQQVLSNVFNETDVDVATLSSTHLPFLLTMFKRSFSHITFLDPANYIAKIIYALPQYKPLKRKKLRIFTSGNITDFQKKLTTMGFINKVKSFSI